jgi:hypothetical protein
MHGVQQTVVKNPDWIALSQYEAETTVTDKATRIFNHFIFPVGLYGIYALATGRTGVVAYASYLALGLVMRKVAATILGYLVYPATITSFSKSKRNSLDQQAQEQTSSLRLEKFIVQKIPLYKSGTRYDAVHITHPDIIDDGNWTVNALGNCMAMERYYKSLAKENFANGCNTLLINGPSVVHSGGWPTRYQMGAGFKAGIRFLEQKVKAKCIVMHGFSLGGGMMGEAVLNHDFIEGQKKGIRYLSITDRSFSRLSTLAGALISNNIGKIAGGIVKSIFYITGMELDGVAAARKLDQLGIQQIIIQHASQKEDGSDGVILDRASLAYNLRKDSIIENKVFLESAFINHTDLLLPEDIRHDLNCNIKEFVRVKS